MTLFVTYLASEGHCSSGWCTRHIHICSNCTVITLKFIFDRSLPALFYHGTDCSSLQTKISSLSKIILDVAPYIINAEDILASICTK